MIRREVIVLVVMLLALSGSAVAFGIDTTRGEEGEPDSVTGRRLRVRWMDGRSRRRKTGDNDHHGRRQSDHGAVRGDGGREGTPSGIGVPDNLGGCCDHLLGSLPQKE